MTQAALAYAPDAYYTDMPVGEILRRARQHYGQSIADIERTLRIRACLIEAIEGGDHSKLPGRVYAIGFVRSYAEYLGLDGEKMVQLFKGQSGGIAEKPELNFPVAANDGMIPSIWLILGSLGLGLVLLIGWGIAHAIDRSSVTEVAAVPTEMQQRLGMKAAESYGPPAPAIQVATPEEAMASASAPVPEKTDAKEAAEVEPAAAEEKTQEQISTQQAQPAPEQTASAGGEEPGIILNLVENSWVEIKDANGKAIVSRVLKAGDQYFVPDRPGLTMSIGNAGGVELVIDGHKLPALGGTGEIRRNIPLNSKTLKESL